MPASQWGVTGGSGSIAAPVSGDPLSQGANHRPASADSV
jgi:hypothetical protein